MKTSKKWCLVILFFVIFQLFPVLVWADCEQITLEGGGSSMSDSGGGSRCDYGVCYWSSSNALGVRFQIYKYENGVARRIGRGVDVWEMKEFTNANDNFFSNPNDEGLNNKISGTCSSLKSFGSIYSLTTSQYLNTNQVYYDRDLKRQGLNDYSRTWVINNVVKKITSNDLIVRGNNLFGLSNEQFDDMKENSSDYYITAEVLFRWVVQDRDSDNSTYKNRVANIAKAMGKTTDEIKGKYFWGTVAEAGNYVAFGSPINLLYISPSDEDVGEIVPNKIHKTSNVSGDLAVYTNGSSVANSGATCQKAYGINIYHLSRICTECDDSDNPDEEKCDPDDPTCETEPDKPEPPDIPEPTGSSTGCDSTPKTCTEDKAHYNGSCESNFNGEAKMTSQYCEDDSDAGYSKEYNKNNVYYRVVCDETAIVKNVPTNVNYILNKGGSYNVYIGYTLDYKRVCKIQYKMKNSDGTYGWTTDTNHDDAFNKSWLKAKIEEFLNGTKMNGRKVSKSEAQAGINSTCGYNITPYNINYYCNIYGTTYGMSSCDSNNYYGCVVKSYYNDHYFYMQDCFDNCKNTDPYCSYTCQNNYEANYKENYRKILKYYEALEELGIDSSKSTLSDDEKKNNNVTIAAKNAYEKVLDLKRTPNYVDENVIKNNNRIEFEVYDQVSMGKEDVSLEISPVYCTEPGVVETYCYLDGKKLTLGTTEYDNAIKYTCGENVVKKITNSKNEVIGYETTIHYALPSTWRSEIPDSNGKFVFNDKDACKRINNGKECTEIKNGYSVEPVGDKLIYHLNNILGKYDKKIHFEGLGMCGKLKFDLSCSYNVQNSNVCDPEGDNYQPNLCSCQTYCDGDITCLSQHCPEECDVCGGIEDECPTEKSCVQKCDETYQKAADRKICYEDECCKKLCAGDIVCLKECGDPCEDGDCEICFKDGCEEYVYRTIDLNNPFPNDRKPGKNWQNKIDYITKSDSVNVDRDSTNGRSEEYEYRVELTSATIAKIRENKDLKDLYLEGERAEKVVRPTIGNGNYYCSKFLHDEQTGLISYGQNVDFRDREGRCR